MEWRGFRLPGLRSRGIRFLVFGPGQVGGGFSFSHPVVFKIDAMSVVNDLVEDGVGDRGLANIPRGMFVYRRYEDYLCRSVF